MRYESGRESYRIHRTTAEVWEAASGHVSSLNGRLFSAADPNGRPCVIVFQSFDIFPRHASVHQLVHRDHRDSHISRRCTPWRLPVCTQYLRECRAQFRLPIRNLSNYNSNSYSVNSRRRGDITAPPSISIPRTRNEPCHELTALPPPRFLESSPLSPADLVPAWDHLGGLSRSSNSRLVASSISVL